MSEYAYIGIKKCGCVVAAVVDNPDHVKDVAKEVASCIREGLTIEHMPLEEARERLGSSIRCECDEKPAAETPTSGQMDLEMDRCLKC